MIPNNLTEIDLTAVEHNLGVVRRACAAAPVRVCAVLKADAYGLGALRVAKRLEAAGVDMFAVFAPEEAHALLEGVTRASFLLLAPVRTISRSDALYRAATTGRLHLTVHDDDQLTSLEALADRYGLRLPLHVDVNTGMSRGGASPAAAAGMLARIAEHKRLTLAGLSTHFACADSDAQFTREQAHRFDRFRGAVAESVPESCAVHAANTAGLFRSAAYHYDMVRVGLALFGYANEKMANPEDETLALLADELRPAAKWLSHVVHLARLDPDQTVGYGATFRAARPTRLALVPIGYANGYPHALSNSGVVRVALGADRWAEAPVVGRVNMDQLTIDITDLPDGAVHIGSAVELFGADKSAANYPPALAKAAGTITYELLSRMGSRGARKYIAVEPGTTLLRAGGPTIGTPTLHIR